MLISAQKFRLYTKNAVLKKTVPKFLGRVRQHLLLKPRNGSKYKNCSEKITEWSSRDAKCSFDNNAEKTSQEVLKLLALHPKRIENINFLTEKWFTTNWSFVQMECGFDKRTRSFRRIHEIGCSNHKKK